MSGKRGLMYNTGHLGHVNQFNVNIYGCLQGTVLGSLGGTKMSVTAAFPKTWQPVKKTYSWLQGYTLNINNGYLCGRIHG